MLFPSFTNVAAWCLALALPAQAHYRWSKLQVNGQLSGDWEYIRENSNGILPSMPFVEAVEDFRCNAGSFANAGKTKVYKVNPGDEIGFQLWYHATMKHPGPLTIHMSKAPGDVRLYRGDGDWFKVHQEIICRQPTNGFLNDMDWCTWDRSTVTFRLPLSTPPGQYLVRPEHIAIHGASSGGAQFYFQCAQIEVGGNGAGTPGPLVKIPGLYDSEDPALRFFIYGARNYPYTNIGQHAVWTGDGNSGNNSTNNGTAPYPTRGGGNNEGEDDGSSTSCTTRRKARSFQERRVVPRGPSGLAPMDRTTGA